MFKSSLVSLMIAVLWVVAVLAMLETSDKAMPRRALWPLREAELPLLTVVQRTVCRIAESEPEVALSDHMKLSVIKY
jgi:hypothetical protein